MQSLENNTQVFLALVRAGLWETDVLLLPYGNIDFNEVYRLAQAQSVVGLVAAGLEHVVDFKVPKEDALIFVGEALQLEQRNAAMNMFIGDVIDKMRVADIYTLLVKGQGVAQCYERPLWRACGDVDLLLSDVYYEKAKAFLSPLASSVETEATREKHFALTIDSWLVELHGSLRSDCLRKMDRGIDQIQDDLFCAGNVRSWKNGRTHVFLPSANNDVLLVFTHILKHFFRNGIGLRQICDWCRLLWSFKDTIKIDLLEKRISAMGIMTEWKTFASLAVNTLGMPMEAVPLYEGKEKWYKKADHVLARILADGNFGHNRDLSYANKHKPIVRKIISFWRHTCNSVNQFRIFPFDTIKVWNRMVLNGIKDLGKE